MFAVSQGAKIHFRFGCSHVCFAELLGTTTKLYLGHNSNIHNTKFKMASENEDVDATALLEDDQKTILLQFQEIVAKDDQDECIRILRQHQWNLEASVQSSFNESEGLPSVYDNVETSEVVSQERLDTTVTSPSAYSPGRSAVDVHRRSVWLEWLGRLAMFPLQIAHVGYRFCYHCVTEVLLFAVRLIIPNVGRPPTDPVADVISFKEKYENKYGNRHPTFYQGSYSQVIADCKKELKFLLVYLHKDDHYDTPTFCRDVLSNYGFTDYINGNMLFWACDVTSNEGYRVARAMRCRSFPFLAIVCLRDNKMVIVQRIEGLRGVDELLAICAQKIDENEPALVAARADRQERSFTQELRSEQDAAYLESLALDRKKEEEKKRKEEESKQIEQQKLEKENEKQRKIHELALRRQRCREIVETVQEPNSTNDGSVQIRIKLPNGRQLQRYFLKSNKLQFLYDYVLSNDDAPAEFLLSTNYPRKTFPIENNEDKTFEDCGITTSVAMFIQNIADDSSDEES